MVSWGVGQHQAAIVVANLFIRMSFFLPSIAQGGKGGGRRKDVEENLFVKVFNPSNRAAELQNNVPGPFEITCT